MVDLAGRQRVRHGHASRPGGSTRLDGNRFVPGFDPQRGGDMWTTDAAITVIENDPDWRG